MSEAVNFYKEPGEPLDRAAIDLGPYVPAPDDGVLVCRCEEVTKGDIRRAIHDGMFNCPLMYSTVHQRPSKATFTS